MVLQSNFDKAFIKVVEYLITNWRMHKKFRYRKELFNQLGLHSKNWIPMQKGLRHVPKAKAAEIKSILINQYQVSSAFLLTAVGEMFTNEAHWLKNSAPSLTKDEQIEQLKKEVTRLKRDIKKLRSQQQKSSLKIVAKKVAIVKNIGLKQ